MKISLRRKNLFLYSYMLLIILTIFSPERYGTTLKYVFVPLAAMLVFARIQKRMTPFRCFTIAFMGMIVISTALTTVPGLEKFNAVFRSLLIMVAAIGLLSEITISAEDFEKVKTCYITCVVVSGIIMLFSIIFLGSGREKFIFLFGGKDINYLMSFMIPGCYMALRRLVFEKRGNRLFNYACITATVIGVVFLETRAAFITVLLMAALLVMEYIVQGGLNARKIIIIFLLGFASVGAAVWMFASPEFARLLNFEAYGDDVRLVIWAAAIQAFFNNKIWGSGLGASCHYSQLAVGYQTHNNFIDILGDFGLIGMGIFIAMVICLFRVPRHNRMKMLSFFVACMLPMAFINGFQTIVFWLPILLMKHERNMLCAKKRKIGGK